MQKFTVEEKFLIRKKGMEVFRDRQKFKQWLRSPLGSLGGKRPLDCPEHILTILERIEHGVYS